MSSPGSTDGGGPDGRSDGSLEATLPAERTGAPADAAAPETKPGELDATVGVDAKSYDATLGVDAKSYEATVRSEDAVVGPATWTGPPPSPKRYQLLEEVGRGGLGRVVAAHDAVLERTVAIKELAHDSRDARYRFDREILITARLQHPGIVPIYDADRTQGAQRYTMRLVTGRPLVEAIEAAKGFDERLGLLPNVLAAADAVAYAHGERVVHRDLKPHNVLLGPHGETVVIDWGIAKELDGPGPRTGVGAVLGTPAYMAPEQARGAEVDERADVYALGAMLYHVISGAIPHEGKTLDEMLGNLGRGAITPLAERAPRAPAALVAIVEKAMALDPQQRYRTATELADDLRRYTTDRIVSAHRYSLGERARRWLRDNAIGVVAFALVLAFAAYSLAGLRRERAAALDGARRELELAVTGVRRDVAFSLDQADPMLAGLRSLADPALPLADVAPRLHALVVARPGVSNASIGFADGVFRGTFVAGGGDIEINETVVGERGSTRRNYRVGRGAPTLVDQAFNDYDIRRRPHYLLAARSGARVWTPPRTYFTSKTTGVTCAEPILAADGALVAVTTVDFDVGALSGFVAHPPLEGARAVVFAGDGSVLAYPGAAASRSAVADTAVKEGRLLRTSDFGDPILVALADDAARRPPTELRVVELAAGGEEYLAAVSPIGGRRGGVAAPLDWYVAAMLPAKVLLGPAWARERRTEIAVAVAFALAALVALGARLASARRRPLDAR